MDPAGTGSELLRIAIAGGLFLAGGAALIFLGRR